MTTIVTDISYYQNGNPPKPIDFNKMECQCSGVMIRVAYGLKLDSQFLANYAGASRLFRGTYLYFLAGLSPTEQAKLQLKYATPEDELPLALDLEWRSGDGMSNRPGINYVQQILDYLHVIEDAGRRPVIYTGYGHVLSYLKRPAQNTKAYDLWTQLSNYRLWQAQYHKDPRLTLSGPNVPQPWLTAWMWQASADGNGLGKMYGVHSTSIDLNIMN